jgi:hypothetical protein
MSIILSVVIPICNNDHFDKIINSFLTILAFDDVEIIIVNNNNNNNKVFDDIFDKFNEYKDKKLLRIIHVDTESRGMKLQTGIDNSNGDAILCHHPRSLIEPTGILWLYEKTKQNMSKIGKKDTWWGGFTHQFDNNAHWLLRFTSWYSNYIRPRSYFFGFGSILYLDHCIFFTKSLLTRKIPPVAIFEDTEICLILRENDNTPILVPYVSVTSAIRFQTNGIFYQAFLNQWMKFLYNFGLLDNSSLNAQYEKGLELNGRLE